jgi:hypothetical protein
MPDGDRVHPRLARPYQKVYKQLCEGQFDSESLAAEAVETVKHQLQQGGDAPAHLVAQIASRLAVIPKEPLLRGMVDRPAKSREIEQMVAQAGVPKRIGEHIAEASKELLYDIRTGETISKTNVQLMERTLNRLFTAEFERLVPEAMQERFVLLYRRYVNEWEQVRPQIERGLLGEEELRAAA